MESTVVPLVPNVVTIYLMEGNSLNTANATKEAKNYHALDLQYFEAQSNLNSNYCKLRIKMLMDDFFYSSYI